MGSLEAGFITLLLVMDFLRLLAAAARRGGGLLFVFPSDFLGLGGFKLLGLVFGLFMLLLLLLRAMLAARHLSQAKTEAPRRGGYV
jgi:hypothetical protein